MPAGGTWTAQNKVRPGAYINFKSVPRPIGVLGERGTVAVALPMIWGPENELIEVYSSELLDGSSLSKIGCTAFDTEISLPYRLALSGSYKALFFRADKGGTKATTSLTNLTVSAKYAGSVGNNLIVAIVKNEDKSNFDVQILYKEVLKETFTIKKLGELEDVESEWVEFTVTESQEATEPTPTATAGQPLTGGTNGTVSDEGTAYTKFFELLKRANWQCMAIQTSKSSVYPLIEAFIKQCRDDLGKKVQAVCYNYDSDYEGIIKTDQGYVTDVDTVTPELFPIYVASITAGAQVNESNTCREVSGAVDIINYYDNNQIIEKLKEGWFVLSDRQDGVVLVEQDINSLHSFTTDKNKEFSKNRVIRVLDEIGNTSALIFNRNYAGKMDNNDAGRNIFKGELINLCNTLQNMSALKNFGGADDITVMQGTDIDSVVVDFTVQPVDAMEKLYMTVNVSV